MWRPGPRFGDSTAAAFFRFADPLGAFGMLRTVLLCMRAAGAAWDASAYDIARTGRPRPSAYTRRRWSTDPRRGTRGDGPLDMPDPIRLGIVGVGAVAQAVHLPLLERLPDHFRIAAVADVSATLVEIIGERHRVPSTRRFLALDDMLGAPDLDAVMILTSGSHGEAILRTPPGGPRGLDRETDGVDARRGRRHRRRARGRRRAAAAGRLHEAVRPGGRAGRVAKSAAQTAGCDPARSMSASLHPSSQRQLAHARLLPPPGDVPAATLAAFQADARGCTRRRSVPPARRSGRCTPTSCSAASSTTSP